MMKMKLLLVNKIKIFNYNKNNFLKMIWILMKMRIKKITQIFKILIKIKI